MGCTQDRRNRFHSWPTPQNATPISSIPRAYSPFLSQAASPLIQRNSRRLSTPLYHCFTWEEMRKGDEGGSLSRNSKRPLLLPPLSLSSFALPLLRLYIHPPPVDFDNGESTNIEFRSMYSTKFSLNS